MKKLLAFSIALLYLSCSSSENTIDSSAITSFRWKLTAFRTSQPIDLNLDGVASTDMILEFNCIGNEEFYFNQPNNGTFFFNEAPLLGHGNPDNTIHDYFCPDETFTGFSYLGNCKMIDENTIQLHFEELISGQFPFEPYNLRYQLIDDKLISTREQSYPATYIANSHWTTNTITITREYSKVPSN